MLKVRPSTRPLALVGAILICLACSPGAAPNQGASPARPSAAGAPAGSSSPASQAAPAKKVRLIIIPTGVNTWPYLLADRRGWFTEEGVQAEITKSYDQAKALIAGSVDVMSNGADEPVVANSRGADIVVVGIMSNHPAQFMVGAPDITDVRQLQGKAIGMTDYGSSDYAVAYRLLSERGADPESVAWRRIGGSRNRFAALEAGQIQGTPLDPTAATQAKAAGKNILASPADFGNYPWNVLAVRRDWGQANRDAVIGVLRAIYRTMAFMNDPSNDEALIADLPEPAETDPALLHSILEVIRSAGIKLYDNDRPHPAGLQPAVDLFRASGAIKGELDLARMVDTTYYDEAFGQR